MSVTGEFGKRTRDRAAALLDEGLVHFVASDAHGTEWRAAAAQPRRAAPSPRGWGEEAAERLTRTHPAGGPRRPAAAAAAPAEAR